MHENISPQLVHSWQLKLIIMSTKCRQCNGTRFVQTTFGPKPCPSYGGSGYVDNEDRTGTSAWSFGDWIAAVLIVIAILYVLSKL